MQKKTQTQKTGSRFRTHLYLRNPHRRRLPPAVVAAPSGWLSEAVYGTSEVFSIVMRIRKGQSFSEGSISLLAKIGMAESQKWLLGTFLFPHPKLLRAAEPRGCNHHGMQKRTTRNRCRWNTLCVRVDEKGRSRELFLASAKAVPYTNP